MSSSKASALVTITNKQAEEATRKSKRNGGHANTNLSEKTIELRKREQALALEQLDGDLKQPSKKQKRKSIHYNQCYLLLLTLIPLVIANEKGGKGSGTGSHKNSQQNITDRNEDYRKKEGTNQERFIKTLAVSLQKPGSLKGLDESSVKVKFRNFGGVSNYVSLTNLKGVSDYLKYDDVMDLYDNITTNFGVKLHVLSAGYYVDRKNKRAVVADKDAELIFELKPRVEGKLAVLDLAKLTDAKLATITCVRGKETGQHASHAASMPQPEFVVGDNEPVTTQKEAVKLLKGGNDHEKAELLTDMRLKLAKEFTKDPHAFMKDINTTAITDTWKGRVGHWKSKNSKIVATQVVVRFGRPFTREDFL